MSEIIQAIIDNGDTFRWLLVAAGVWTVVRIVNDPSNELEWLDLVSMRGLDGKRHPDWDQIGKGAAVVTGVYAMIALLPYAKGDLKGYAVIMFTFFTYAGAVKGWQSYLRSKSGQTVTITEPATPPPGPTKTTVIESGTAPPKNGPVQVEVVNAKPLRVKETPDNPD